MRGGDDIQGKWLPCPEGDCLLGAEGAPPLPLSKSCSEPEWSPTVRQDTAPSSGSLLPEQQSSGHRAEETCGLYESGQERVAPQPQSWLGVNAAGRQHNDPNSGACDLDYL
ncbi:hypothetical protein SKAU_G00320040 [Synaphobranchus kaupii]|uniref:Uncharacterized protein n=1 Tax=Synaphobranchus kaupii TaxID=118154 RepID=A0A9Q1IJP4_SYNKA|nr:hypothetical protein SKAU_G00320040 [Synaphobranchus kaupii]